MLHFGIGGVRALAASIFIVYDSLAGEIPTVTSVRESISGRMQMGITADGRFLVVPSTQNVYLLDWNANSSVLISKNAAGGPADGASYSPTVSDDGRHIAFLSDATNLVAGDGNGFRDVFLYDRLANITSLVSTTDVGSANGNSLDAAISGAGRFVAFSSDARNLAEGDTNNVTDVFLQDCGPINNPPDFSTITNQTIDEGQLLSIDLTATDSDQPANNLTYSFISGQPVGAQLNPETGRFAWTPTESDGGASFLLTVRVTDDGNPPLSDTIAFSIQVNETQTPPALAEVPNSIGGAELTNLTFDANASDADLPPQQLSFSLLGAPSGATINASTGVFSWTPAEAQGPGLYTFSVRLSDGHLNTDSSITTQVSEVNSAPVLASIGNKTVIQGSTLSFTASTIDLDIPANTLTYSLGPGASAGMVINSSTGAFTWTPNKQQKLGNFVVTIQVRDNGTPVLSDFETITITLQKKIGGR